MALSPRQCRPVPDGAARDRLLSNPARCEGGAPALLHRLAQTYVATGTRFPPIPNLPDGYVVHVRVAGVGGLGAWAG